MKCCRLKKAKYVSQFRNYQTVFSNKINYNWKEKLIRKIDQKNISDWIFPYKKYTLLCGEDFTTQKFKMGGASQISYTSKSISCGLPDCEMNI